MSKVPTYLRVGFHGCMCKPGKDHSTILASLPAMQALRYLRVAMCVLEKTPILFYHVPLAPDLGCT